MKAPDIAAAAYQLRAAHGLSYAIECVAMTIDQEEAQARALLSVVSAILQKVESAAAALGQGIVPAGMQTTAPGGAS